MMERKKNNRKIRVLISKSKMDVHDRGVRYTARKMREGGLEVILIRHGMIDEVANIAEQEGVNVIGLSFSAGGHISSFKLLQEILKKRGIDDILLIAGGVIPEDDVPEMKKIGVAGIFGAGSSADDAVSFIKSSFSEQCKDK